MFHPKLRDSGIRVEIQHPDTPTPPTTWEHWRSRATWVPEGEVPAAIHDIALTSRWARRGEIDWAHLAQAADFDEPPFRVPSGLEAAAGAVVLEPHGRVWVVHPTNVFGGYRTTFPKGRAAKETSLRETAVRETFEEAGLLVEPFAYLADSKRTQTYTRYYLSRRIDGSPADMGWESQAVSLVPVTQLKDLLNRSVDKKLAQSLLDIADLWGQWFCGTGPLVDGHKIATRYSRERHPLPERHRTLEIAIRLNAEQAARVRRGYIPVAMEEKWFAYYEDDVLYQHRSWTGYLIFVTTFVPEGDGLRATRVVVNQDPRQYSETDEREIRQSVETLILSLAKAADNEALKDPLVEVLEKVVEPNYLGSPEVVTGLVEGFLNQIVGRWRSQRSQGDSPSVSYSDLLEANDRITKIFFGQNPEYRLIGTWNSAEQLGASLVRYFDMDPDYYAGENLYCILSEAMAALTLRCNALLDSWIEADRDWDGDVLPKLRELGLFATTVLMGTNTVIYPGKTLTAYG